MKKTENQIILVASIAIIICFLLMVFSSTKVVSDIDKKFFSIYNIMAFLSMLFSAIALLVAAIAYKKTLNKPNLKLVIVPWSSDEEGPALAVESNNQVTLTRPLSSWQFFLTNTGKISAKNPIVKIRFKGAYYGLDQFPGWKQAEHANALGWYAYQWSPNLNDSQAVHKDFAYELPTMYFSGTHVADDLKIEVIMAADEMDTISYELLVRIVKY